MLALTWWGAPFGLGLILGPPLALAVILLLTPRGRAVVSQDLREFHFSPGKNWRAGIGFSWGCWGQCLLCAAPGRALSHVGLGRGGHLGLQGQNLLYQPGPGPDLH